MTTPALCGMEIMGGLETPSSHCGSRPPPRWAVTCCQPENLPTTFSSMRCCCSSSQTCWKQLPWKHEGSHPRFLLCWHFLGLYLEIQGVTCAYTGRSAKADEEPGEGGGLRRTGFCCIWATWRENVIVVCAGAQVPTSQPAELVVHML